MLIKAPSPNYSRRKQMKEYLNKIMIKLSSKTVEKKSNNRDSYMAIFLCTKAKKVLFVEFVRVEFAEQNPNKVKSIEYGWFRDN